MAELPAEMVTGVVTGAAAVVAKTAAVEEAPLQEVEAAGFALAAAVPRWLAAGTAWPRAAWAALKNRRMRAWPVFGWKDLE